MNNYSDNLKATVDETLNALSAEKSKIASEQTTSQYNLYYAQGAELTARDKLSSTDDKAKTYCVINAQGVFTDNQATNLVSAVTETDTTVSTAITNVATASSNMQIASNAVALLASDVGAALNVATASLYNTDTYRKISDANKLINECANDAKAISLITLEASAQTSEIIAKETLANTQSLKTKISDLLASTQAEFDNLSALQVSENKDVANASVAERAAEGTLLNADRNEDAIGKAYNNAVCQLNHNLSVKVVSGCTFKLKFNPLPEKLFQYPPADTVVIPSNDPKYFLALVPNSKKGLLTPDLTSELFAESGMSGKDPSGTNITISTTRFTPVAAHTDCATETVATVIYAASTQSVDIYGDPIVKGSDYVTILYIELAMPYKQYINNYADIISSPSEVFVLATQLPAAASVTCAAPNSGADNLGQLNFSAAIINIPSSTDTPASVQYRAILIKDANQCLNLLTTRTETIRDGRADVASIEIQATEVAAVNGDDENATVATPVIEKPPCETSGNLPIYFNKDIALQTSPSNYYSVNQASPTPLPDVCDTQSGATQAQDGTENYHITIPLDGTDNFGEPLVNGQNYFPKILTVVDGDTSISNQYIPALSAPLEPITITIP
ncbi:MAG: hypothetical protein COA42_06415 [Alteromonadaceae bacterium]|nr:MAG: hypothetical protein COA42_06415 [Alteromonadaceae bacterium]